MGTVALQLERSTSGVVAASASVVFNTVLFTTGNISYAPLTGIITINEPGRYVINWWAVTQAAIASAGPGFALSSSLGASIQSNSPNKIGPFSGAGVINITSTPATISLVNSTSGDITFSSLVHTKAGLTLFKDEPPGDLSDSAGLFILTDSLGQSEAIPIAAICGIYTGEATVYDPSITYLAPPSPLPKGCDTDLIAAIHDYLPIPTEVIIQMGVTVQASGEVYQNEYGILVLSDAGGNTPIFVSVSKIARIITAAPDLSGSSSKPSIVNKIAADNVTV
ncbi:MAG: hypothetical protein K0Q75_1713 [Anaerospora sp.]|nr:hypothetical protein [Anaerospora sp.]